MSRRVISTNLAPEALGPYSQAVLCDNTLYISGQLGINPKTAMLAESIEEQITLVFDNLEAVLHTAKGELVDIVKLNIYLCDLVHFQLVNKIMQSRFTQPYPARAAIGVKELPKGGQVEMDAIAVIQHS